MRGRPPVMSLVLVVSRGILASMSPGLTSCLSVTMRCAPVGSRYFRSPALPLMMMGRALLGAHRLDDDLLREAGDVVGLLADVLAFDDVLELDLAAELRQHRRGERIPLDQRLAGVDLLAVADLEGRAVHERVALLLAPLVVHDR